MLAESSKYLYLTFSERGGDLVDHYVITTEGHLLPPIPSSAVRAPCFMILLAILIFRWIHSNPGGLLCVHCPLGALRAGAACRARHACRPPAWHVQLPAWVESRPCLRTANHLHSCTTAPAGRRGSRAANPRGWGAPQLHQALPAF